MFLAVSFECAFRFMHTDMDLKRSLLYAKSRIYSVNFVHNR